MTIKRPSIAIVMSVPFCPIPWATASTTCVMPKPKIRFIFGLGITQVVDAVAHGMGQNGTLITIAIDGLFIVMLILCSRWAKAGSQGAFLGGMIAYALDGVLLLFFN